MFSKALYLCKLGSVNYNKVVSKFSGAGGYKRLGKENLRNVAFPQFILGNNAHIIRSDVKSCSHGNRPIKCTPGAMRHSKPFEAYVDVYYYSVEFI